MKDEGGNHVRDRDLCQNRTRSRTRLSNFRFHLSVFIISKCGGEMRKLPLSAALLSLLILLPATAFAQRMKVGYWTSGFSLGFGAVMEQMKFAESQGLNVEWVKSAGVNGPTRAIVSNAIDIAFAAPSTNSIGLAADGVPVKLVLTTQIAEAQIVALDGSPIKTPGDLKGKKIGMSPPRSEERRVG